MKKLLCIIFLLSMAFTILPENVKIVKIPKDTAIEKQDFRETFIRNLCEDEEIFQVMSITICDNFIFLLSAKPVGIYKLDLQGKTIAKSGREGEGPGEFVFPGNLNHFKNHIVFHDLLRKVLFYSLEPDFIKEVKLPIFSMELFVNNEDHFVMSTTRITQSDKYFRVYSQDGKLLRSFGEKDLESNPKNSFDYIFSAGYDPAKDGIWAALGNCYNLLYFEKEKLKAEIREKKDFFREFEKKDEKSGRKFTELTGRPIKIIVEKEKIFYFYKKDNKFYCDIFNKNNYKLLRRIKLERYYRRMAHYKEGIFYGIYRGLKGEEDHQLYRLELK